MIDRQNLVKELLTILNEIDSKKDKELTVPLRDGTLLKISLVYCEKEKKKALSMLRLVRTS